MDKKSGFGSRFGCTPKCTCADCRSPFVVSPKIGSARNRGDGQDGKLLKAAETKRKRRAARGW